MARHTPYYDFDGQNNLQTVNTYVMGIPAPIVADRIWDTRANALSYIADANGSAFPGMRLTVIKDSTDDNNGLYYVKPTLNGSGNPVRPYSLVKLTNDINALSLITANSASSVTEITTNQADPYVNLTKKAAYDASTYTLVDSIHFSGQKDGSNNDVIKVVGNAGSVAINFPTVSPHYVLAGPSTGSSSAVPSFRQLKIEEIDELDSLGSTTGYLKRIATGTAPNITYSWELGTPSGGGDGTVTEISHGDGIKFRTAADDADLTTITSTGKIKLEFASSSAIGAIKLGFTNDNTNRKYAIQLGANSGESANERAYVQIPTFSASGTNHKAGLVVDPGSTAGSKKFLREDASWNQVSMENILEVTTNSTSTGFLKRTSSGTAPNITYGWSFVSESNIDTKVTQTGTNTNAGYPILLKYTNDTGNETNTVWFANATNNGATINANSGKITCPGFILRESGSGITTKKILVGDGTSITAPASGDDGKFLKANVASGGTVSFSWDSAGGGTDTKTDQTIIANPSQDASKRPLLIAKGTTASTSINDETLFTKSLYYTPKADTLYVGNVETTGNVTATGNISGANITASGKFSGIAEITANQYFSSSKYGIDMQNSDIIHANSIFCNDTSEKGEGLHFFRSNNTYDSLRIDNSGLVKFDKGWGYSSGTVTGGTTYDVAISASQTASGITVQTAGTTSDKYYPVQTNPDTGMAVVNVPWSGGGSGSDTWRNVKVNNTQILGTGTNTSALNFVNGTGISISGGSNGNVTISATGGGGGGFEHYQMYSFIDPNGTWIRPFEAMCHLFSGIMTDNKSNDIHAYVQANILEMDPTAPGAGADGHIPLGVIVMLFGAYLVKNNCSTGRFIYESVGWHDYANYIIANNENSNMWGDADASTYGLFTDSGIYFADGNWDSGGLPMGISEYNAYNATQVGTKTVNFSTLHVYDSSHNQKIVYDRNGNEYYVKAHTTDVYDQYGSTDYDVYDSQGNSIGVVKIADASVNCNSEVGAEIHLWHKYTFNFMNVAEGSSFKDILENEGNSVLTNIIEDKPSEAAGAFSAAFKDVGSFDIFDKASGMIVTVEHTSSVGYYTNQF